jgi:isocitrate dehydrogenase (NAD+)
MSLYEYADKIEKATLNVSHRSPYSKERVIANRQTIADGKHITGDLGGKASTQQYTDAILSRL